MDRVIVNADLEAYLDRVREPSVGVLAEMEALAQERNFPIIGPHVGGLLELLARSIAAHRVLELGSGFGYSTMFFADAVGPEGRVIHTDASKEHSEQARDFLEHAGLISRVTFELGDALEIIDRYEGPFDVIFCDIDKEDYPRVPDLAVPRLRHGGLLIFDNALWHGRVVDAEPDEPTAAVIELNTMLHERADLVTSILPLRDGVSVSLKL